MMQVKHQPTDTKFVGFREWHERACAARDRLIREWEAEGRPARWRPKFNKNLYREFRAVFLYEAFHEKCAYCESKLHHVFSVQVEHYRPKGSLTENGKATAHPGYFWLAYEWWNLVPTCSHCNTWHTDHRSKERNSGKLTEFPIRGCRVSEPSADPGHWQAELSCEAPLLLNPYLHEPEEHLSFVLATGALVPMSSEGSATIRICDLNRSALCERRRGQGKEVLGYMVSRLLRLEPIDSFINDDTEYSLWRRSLLRGRLKQMCDIAGVK